MIGKDHREFVFHIQNFATISRGVGHLSSFFVPTLGYLPSKTKIIIKKNANARGLALPPGGGGGGGARAQLELTDALFWIGTENLIHKYSYTARIFPDVNISVLRSTSLRFKIQYN